MPMMTGLLYLLYIVHLGFEKMAVQSSLHNCPADSSECLKLSSTSASKAFWEKFGRCKFYHALAVMFVEKLQFSLFLISCSQGILSSSYSPGIFPKDCLFTCIFHSL